MQCVPPCHYSHTPCRYRFGRILDKGSHGKVYEAMHVQSGTPVAIKEVSAKVFPSSILLLPARSHPFPPFSLRSTGFLR
jgi:hypothetical protein